MLLCAAVLGQKGILKLFAARLNKRGVRHFGGVYTKDRGPPRRGRCLNFIQGTCSSPVPLRGKDWKIESPVAAAAPFFFFFFLFFFYVRITYKQFIVPIYWWKKCHHIYCSQNYFLTSIFNKLHCLLGCPVSFVLMPGCSLDCCETYRSPLNLEFIPYFICTEQSVP